MSGLPTTIVIGKGSPQDQDPVRQKGSTRRGGSKTVRRQHFPAARWNVAAVRHPGSPGKTAERTQFHHAGGKNALCHGGQSSA